MEIASHILFSALLITTHVVSAQVPFSGQLDFGPYGTPRWRSSQFGSDLPEPMGDNRPDPISEVTVFTSNTSRFAKFRGLSIVFESGETFDAGDKIGNVTRSSFKLHPDENIVAVYVSNRTWSFEFVQFVTDQGRTSQLFGDPRRRMPILVNFSFPLRRISGRTRTSINRVKFHTAPPRNYCASIDSPSNSNVLNESVWWQGEHIDMCVAGFHFPTTRNVTRVRKCEYFSPSEGKWSLEIEDFLGCREICGDDVVVGKQECDGSDLGEGQCPPLTSSGQVSCFDNCTLDYSRCEFCGDNRVKGQEHCDGELLSGKTCADWDEFETGTLQCSDICTFDTSMCEKCGDALITGTEECEVIDTNAGNWSSVLAPSGNHSCEAYDSMFVGGIVECKNCHISYAKCEFCGDGKVSPGFEDCDPSRAKTGSASVLEPKNPKNCTDLDSDVFIGGILICGLDCRINTSQCLETLVDDPTNHGEPVSETSTFHLWILIGLSVVVLFGVVFATLFYRYRSKR